jgi:hypothetical protein
MRYRGSPRVVVACAGLVSVLLFSMLLYAGVFDGIIQELGSAGYEFLRALNYD